MAEREAKKEIEEEENQKEEEGEEEEAEEEETFVGEAEGAAGDPGELGGQTTV